MAIYYSLSTKGFYDTETVDYPSLPNDVIEITEEQHISFINGINLHSKQLVLENDILVLQDFIRVYTWADIRSTRNNLLNTCDYTQMPDFPGDKEAWAAYRQALRDIPQTFVNPADVIWPTAPGE